ncbi:type I-E CRISPR-associated protein Cse2/CasB [Xenorhabdus anantnagensis]|uniref:Type I-E CRISPR-associated protein Cse2/CasB n=1 Tax=Xenorhabdus anantnagensis TaxID=3025875 RepID=A0ABT5LWN0_9GAMM|nr:type I-E CRISPR-associated protein Cse2/CasB [Xenorhabdus anantnagensis]MDC9597484.1 type I-E CRISPR-associated protein Cse2/CasB [Xenorhabdus anantnagensis]
MNNLSESRLMRWWESMFLSPSALKEKKITPAPTLYKAELKRCQDIDSVTLAEGFRALWFNLPKDVTGITGESITEESITEESITEKSITEKSITEKSTTEKSTAETEITEETRQKNIILWAMIAVTLVYVKTNTTTNLATAAGTKTENDKPIVSTHRFTQLQAARTPEEFIIRLRRILQQLKGQVSVLSLARDIEQWMKEHHQPRPRRANKRLSVQWAMDYYKAAR